MCVKAYAWFLAPKFWRESHARTYLPFFAGGFEALRSGGEIYAKAKVRKSFLFISHICIHIQQRLICDRRMKRRFRFNMIQWMSVKKPSIDRVLLTLFSTDKFFGNGFSTSHDMEPSFHFQFSFFPQFGISCQWCHLGWPRREKIGLSRQQSITISVRIMSWK